MQCRAKSRLLTSGVARAARESRGASLTSAETPFTSGNRWCVIRSDRELRHRIRPAALVLYRGASDAAGKMAMFLVTVAAARRLTHVEFGYFALATTVGWMGAVAADFGVQMHLAREVAHRPDRSGRLLRRWLPVRVGLGVLALAVSFVVMETLNVADAARLPMELFALTYALNGLSECCYYYFRGLDRTDLESTLTVLQRGLMCALALGALWWSPGLWSLALAMAVPALLTLIAATALARRLTPDGEPLISGNHERIAAEFVRQVAPIGLGILLSALYFRIDVLLLDRWKGTDAVATYNAVFRIVEALRVLPAAVLAVALPRLCRASDLRPLLRLSVPLSAASAGAALALWTAAPWLVPALFGESFASAVPTFRTLLVALPLMTLNYALTCQLIGWNGHREYAVLCGAALVANVFMNWRLIPAAGIDGAAWSTVWTEALLTLGCGAALVRLEMLPATLPSGRSSVEAQG